MRTLYINAKMGVSSDMLAASIYGHIDDKNTILNEMNVYVPKNIHITINSAKSYENKGYQFHVINDNYLLEKDVIKGHGYTYNFVQTVIDETGFPNSIKDKTKEIYSILAKGECAVHDVGLDELHFHEVGSKRAIYTILCVCFLIDKLNVDNIVCSPVNVGFGTTICAHGEVSVPAPATREIINFPIFHNNICGELLTPTGAALLRYFVTDFNEISIYEYLSKSIGIGTKDLGVASGVVSFLLK